MTTTVYATVTWLAPLGGRDSDGYKIGYIDAVAKAAQNDIIVITNAHDIKDDNISKLVASGDTTALEDFSASANTLTMESANTGTISGLVVGRPK